MRRTLSEMLVRAPRRHRLPEPKWRYMLRSEIAEIIVQLGGLAQASEYFGVARSTPTRWRLAGRVPTWAWSKYQAVLAKRNAGG